MGFLPQDYKLPTSDGGYMKLEKGENKFRVLSNAVVGWEGWKDRKPQRFPMDQKPQNLEVFDKDQNGKPSLRHFWAFIVWNYNEKAVQILQITQKSVQQAIENLVLDEDWGEPTEYDLKVIRKGDGKDTEYQVTPSNKGPVKPEIKEQFEKAGIDLSKLFEGSTPFAADQEEEDDISDAIPDDWKDDSIIRP